MEKVKTNKPADIEPVEIGTWKQAKPVNQYELSGKFIKTYSSIQKAAEETGTNYSSLYLCLKGKFKQTHGFQWRYAE